jgi:transcriptional regulator with XRE-family HTH domain
LEIVEKIIIELTPKINTQIYPNDTQLYHPTHRQNLHHGGHNMWLDNIKALKKEKGMSVKQISEKTNLPERTVNRIFSGETENPYVDTLHRIVTVLGGSLDDILADTKMVVGDKNLATLQENVDTVTAERDLIIAENAMLKEKVTALTSENELLKMQLMHKDELLALHNYYNKIKTNK